ncbi:hypothetical protein PHISP_02369 [Aspergillus sp. HF37]|nr:hypothetical protein PHISP_02369 [Aspergillus sp. HF37]
MSSDTLKPLMAVFCEPETKRYIKKFCNLEESWQSHAATPDPDEDDNTVTIETTFDLDLKITRGSDGQSHSVTLAPPSFGKATQETPNYTEADDETTPRASPPAEPTRHYDIVHEFGTDFLWYGEEDPRRENLFAEDASEELSSFPPAVVKSYEAWVITYKINFKESCHDVRYYYPSVFFTVAQDVAWNVAGFLLAWRIALAPQTASVVYLTGRKEYLLKKGQENAVTLEFLTDQAVVLENANDFPVEW